MAVFSEVGDAVTSIAVHMRARWVDGVASSLVVVGIAEVARVIVS